MPQAPSPTPTATAPPTGDASGPADGYEIVRQLLERQDRVLEQLSELEKRVQQTVERFIGKTDSGENVSQVVPDAA